MGSWIADRITSHGRAWLALAGILAGVSACGAGNENFSARSAVDEESQSQPQGSASLEAYPPAPPEDVAIGVDTSRYEDTDPSALTEFRPTLDPYGTWEETPTYGTVWVPSATVVGPDFIPYSSAGHWTYDSDWVWVSDYEWGWAPFHYGRWVHIPGRGWAWIPGRAYSGAWVTWAFGPTYVGWAPLGPSWYWYHGVALGVYAWPTPYYVYCPHHAVFSPTVGTVVVHGPAAAPIAASTPGYLPAHPTVGGSGRIAATPTVAPTPAQLGHPLASAPKPPASGNLAKARALATPEQAERIGARAPASGSGFVAGGSSPRYAPPERDAVAPSRASNGASSARSGFVSTAPVSNSVARSSATASAPDPWRLDPPQAERARVAPPSRIDPRPTYGTAPAYRPSTSITTPSYGPAPRPSVSAPVYRAPSSSPSYSSPSAAPYRAPSVSAPSAPVYRAPSAPAPVYRAPAPAPVYRAPSVSAPVYHAPAPAPAAAPVSRPSVPAPSRPASSGRAGRR